MPLPRWIRMIRITKGEVLTLLLPAVLFMYVAYQTYYAQPTNAYLSKGDVSCVDDHLKMH